MCYERFHFAHCVFVELVPRYGVIMLVLVIIALIDNFPVLLVQ